MGALLDPALAAYGSFWAALNAYTFYPLARSRYQDWRGDDLDKPEYALDKDSVLPAVDMFIPAYDEAEVIHQAIGSADQIDYPSDRLNIHAILEPDDTTTRQALDQFDEQDSLEAISVPESYPGEPNKPRALNYAFNETAGDIVGVLDAEDIADEALLETALEELDAGGKDYAQGILHMANESDGWLNTMFTGEYGHWYRRQLPAFAAADYPVPLGGTTNVFWRDTLEDISDIRRGQQPRHQPSGQDVIDELTREDDLERYDLPTEQLQWPQEEPQTYEQSELWQTWGEGIYREIGQWAARHNAGDKVPWNPQNVTEDFELGLKLWEHDYDIGFMDAETIEESPQRWRDWLHQRTRWHKGKLQTLSQYRDDPPYSLRKRAHIYAQGAVPHLGPINTTGVAATGYAIAAEIDPSPYTQAVLLAGLGGVAGHMMLQADGYRAASDEDSRWKRTGRTIINAATLPAYWANTWIADGRAIYQQIRGDGGWEVTDHHGTPDGDQYRIGPEQYDGYELDMTSTDSTLPMPTAEFRDQMRQAGERDVLLDQRRDLAEQYRALERYETRQGTLTPAQHERKQELRDQLDTIEDQIAATHNPPESDPGTDTRNDTGNEEAGGFGALRTRLKNRFSTASDTVAETIEGYTGTIRGAAADYRERASTVVSRNRNRRQQKKERSALIGEYASLRSSYDEDDLTADEYERMERIEREIIELETDTTQEPYDEPDSATSGHDPRTDGGTIEDPYRPGEWEAVEARLEDIPEAERNAVRNGLLKRYMKDDALFGTDPETVQDRLAASGREIDLSQYETDRDHATALLADQLAFGTSLSEDAIDEITAAAAAQKYGEPTEEGEYGQDDQTAQRYGTGQSDRSSGEPGDPATDKDSRTYASARKVVSTAKSYLPFGN